MLGEPSTIRNLVGPACACAVVFCCLTARAQDEEAAEATSEAAAPDPRSQALRLFEESDGAYKRGEFAHAAVLLEKAHALHPEPVLLYNLGRAYEGLGKNEKAIEAYSRYLRAAPQAQDRGALEQRIRTLRRQLEERKALEEKRAKPREPSPPVADKEESSSGFPGPLPWVVAGVGVAGIGAGLYLGLRAQSVRDDAQAQPVQSQAADEYSRAETLASTANVFLIAGGVLAAGGVTWLIIDKSRTKKTGSLSLSIGPASVALRGQL